jgi:hypothetical protein
MEDIMSISNTSYDRVSIYITPTNEKHLSITVTAENISDLLLIYPIEDIAAAIGININESKYTVDDKMKIFKLEECCWNSFYKGNIEILSNIDYLYHHYYDIKEKNEKIKKLNEIYKIVINKGNYEFIDSLVSNLILLHDYKQALMIAFDTYAVYKSKYLNEIIEKYQTKVKYKASMEDIIYELDKLSLEK